MLAGRRLTWILAALGGGLLLGLGIWLGQKPFDSTLAFERELKIFYAYYNDGNCDAVYRRTAKPFQEKISKTKFCAVIRSRFVERGRHVSGKIVTSEVRTYPDGGVVVIGEYEAVFENKSDWDYFAFGFKGARRGGQLLNYE
jgi:hypothetical protein